MYLNADKSICRNANHLVKVHRPTVVSTTSCQLIETSLTQAGLPVMEERSMGRYLLSLEKFPFSCSASRNGNPFKPRRILSRSCLCVRVCKVGTRLRTSKLI